MAAATLALSAPTLAADRDAILDGEAAAAHAEPYWQCAAFARRFSGIGIRGDAWTWWSQAEGRYRRGATPRVGAVMAFEPFGAMRLGHVATVTAVQGPRDVLVTHANWSPIDGVRGHIERDVAVRDVSPANDWSAVRVWFAPIAALGTTAWPLRGFIYPVAERRGLELAGQGGAVPRLAYAAPEPAVARPHRQLLGLDVLRLALLESERPDRD